MAQQRLTIWINGSYVGFWQKTQGIEELHYADEWVNSNRGRPLSLSLPFTPGNQKHRGDNVKFYFENLLPDNPDILNRLAQKSAAKSTTSFDLMSELGRDCVGAIQLLPEGKQPENIQQIEYEPLSEKQVADVLRNTVSTNPAGIQREMNELRLSIAGAQEKTALLRYKKKWCLPLGSTPTTHIFKLPLGLVGNMQANMKTSVENEWLCSKILQAFSIPVARCEIATFENQKVLIVERFDRKYSSDQSWIMRLPQEDMCQTKGLPSHKKYQADGGMSINDCMQILDGSVNAKSDKKIFFKAQVIFWLLAATDGHSKNFSLRHLSKNEYEMTPLYDVLSAHPIIGPKHNQIPWPKARLAMAIRGSKNYYLIQKIQRRHFIRQAQSAGFSIEEANTLIDEITNSTAAVNEQVRLILPKAYPKGLADKILKGLLKQSKILAKQSS